MPEIAVCESQRLVSDVSLTNSLSKVPSRMFSPTVSEVSAVRVVIDKGMLPERLLLNKCMSWTSEVPLQMILDQSQ